MCEAVFGEPSFIKNKIIYAVICGVNITVAVVADIAQMATDCV
jgi:hypothetical protein